MTRRSRWGVFKLWKLHIRAHVSIAATLVGLLAVGLTGLLVVLSLQQNFRQHVLSQAKLLLTGDVRVSSRREFAPNEREKILEIAKSFGAESQQFDSLFSMVYGEGFSRLIQIYAISDRYPFYGQPLSGDQTPLLAQDLGYSKKIWVYPEILAQLSLNVGDRLKLGDTEFEISDVVTKDVGVSFFGGAIAPRAYIHERFLEDTGLVQFGTTMRRSWLFRVADHATAIALQDALSEAIADPGITVDSYLTHANDTNPVIRYLLDFLGLVALAALLLTLVGFYYFFYSYLQHDLRGWPIWLGLGMEPADLRRMILFTLSGGSVLAAVLATALASILLALVPALLPAELLEFKSSLSPIMALATMGIAWLAAILIGLPMLHKAQELPKLLTTGDTIDFNWRLHDSWLGLPIVGLFFVLAVILAQSFNTAAIFLLCFGLGGALTAGTFRLILIGLEKINFRSTPAAWLSIMSLSRRPFSSVMAFISLALSTWLVLFVPGLNQALQERMQIAAKETLPALFLFDIQEEQTSELEDFLADQNTRIRRLSPLIQSRIISINGEPFDRKDDQVWKTREDQHSERLRNRGLRLSYRESLDESEKIIAGQPLATYDESQTIAELSIEQRYAGRLNLNIGDTMTFDIQGIELAGVIRNLRRVKWTSFEPNFFILVQPGFLDDAPKTFIATVKKPEQQTTSELETKLVRQFPNVSAVHVERLIDELLELVNKLLFAMEMMTAFCLVGGILVLLAIWLFQTAQQGRDLILLRDMGALRSTVAMVKWLPPIGLASLALGLAGGFAYLSTKVFLQFVFEIV